MKTLIVTASSKTKSNKNELPFIFKDKRFVDTLDIKYQKSLLQARMDLLKEFHFNQGPDTHLDQKSGDEIKYLPAFSRYAGRTYSKITDDAWNILSTNPNEFDCVILSAFYGLIRFNEPIRNYVIKQVTKMSSGSTIGNYWKNRGAQDWLFSYIKNTQPDQVKFVLSTSYSDIVNKTGLMSRLKNELNIESEDKQFKQGGMKSMLLRGQYINELLTRKVK
ncbi:MAG: peroxide stress protein YaaA [Candidatus Thorarchaeota archaeon]